MTHADQSVRTYPPSVASPAWVIGMSGFGDRHAGVFSDRFEWNTHAVVETDFEQEQPAVRRRDLWCVDRRMVRESTPCRKADA